MISFIQGTIQSIGKNSLVVMTAGGIGYDIRVRSSEFGVRKDEEIGIHTYLKVSDSAMELYGFKTVEERDFFMLLLSVSGVGPKSAMNILSLGSIDEIQSAIARGDIKYLTAVQGMGKRTAERMIVELKTKVGEERKGNGEQVGGILSDVIDGLVGMGYNKSEAIALVKDLPSEGKSVEDLLRESLKKLSK